MTEDISEGTVGYWFDNNLQDWANQGWDTTEIREYLNTRAEQATEALVHIEYLISACEQLIIRMSYEWLDRLDISNGQFGNWIEQLNNPLNYDEIAQKYLAWAKEYRRWELVLEDSRGDWEALLRGRERLLILARCDALDASSKPRINLLIGMMSDPNAFPELDSRLSELEESEARQKRAVYSSIEALLGDGYDVEYINDLNLVDAMQEIAKRQKLHNLHEIIRLQIIDEIAEYDDQMAERYELQRKALLNCEDESELDQLGKQIYAMGIELNKRLSKINLQIAEWEDVGMIFSSRKIAPKDMFEWETNLPELAKDVDIHLAILERYNYFSERLNDVASVEQYAGYLPHTDALREIVEELELHWKDAELECLSIIERYQTQGLEMDDWEQQITADPVGCLAIIKNKEPIWQSRIDCINELLRIDISFDGQNEIEKRINLLKEIDAEIDVIEDTRLMIERMVTRRARHRVMLERELMELISGGIVPQETVSSSMNIKEFERFISEARRYNSSNRVSLSGTTGISKNVAQRIERRITEEIDLYESAGWYVDEMRAMLQENPVMLAKRVAKIRQHVNNHESLRRRLSSMPWNRDIELALKLQEEMQNPVKLAQISDEIPLMMKKLAKLSPNEEEFSFTAWAPDPRVVTNITSSRPSLEPSDALGDAHEAILESMDRVEEQANEEGAVNTKATATPDKIKSSFNEVEIPSMEVSVDEVGVVAQSTDSKNVVIEKRIPLEPINLQTTDSSDVEHLHLLMSNLGLEDTYDSTGETPEQIQEIRRSLAKNVGVEPRDVRVDRLLRLVLRLLPQSNEHDEDRKVLILDIVSGLKRYQNWVMLRLEARHKASKGKLIQDSATLGKALERIPGPGFQVPLQKDDKMLPGLNELDELKQEVVILLNSLNLESASGVVIAA